jgi:hypothetical protein
MRTLWLNRMRIVSRQRWQQCAITRDSSTCAITRDSSTCAITRDSSTHTIELSEDERDDRIYTEEISPYLETKLYRPRVLAVNKTTASPFREKVLGRALYCVRSKPNLVWMFLSEIVDALFVRRQKKRRGRVIVPVVVSENHRSYLSSKTKELVYNTT